MNQEETEFEREARTCQTKQRYQSKNAAKEEAAKQSRGEANVTVYKCPVCHGWHLTKKRSRNQRRRQRGYKKNKDR